MSNSTKKASSRSKTAPAASSASERTPAFSIIKDIQRQTRRQYTAEEKIRIVLEGLQGEQSVAEICRREGLNTNVYYRWSKEFLEAGKKRLAGDITREATAPEVQSIHFCLTTYSRVVQCQDQGFPIPVPRGQKRGVFPLSAHSLICLI